MDPNTVRPGQEPPQITAGGVVRAAGAIITAWLAYQAAPLVSEASLYQLLLLALVACPAIGVVFSLPGIQIGFFFLAGCSAAAAIGTLFGVQEMRDAADDSGREFVTGGPLFFFVFLFNAIVSLFVLAVVGMALAFVKERWRR